MPIIGGLHHCVNNLDAALSNAAALIKPGGKLYLVEPNAGFVLETIRRRWYQRDRYFDSETERALDPADLSTRAARYFDTERTFHFGGPAYFLILNSLVMRVPVGVKSLIAYPLFLSEYVWNAMAPSRLMPAFGAVLERKP